LEVGSGGKLPAVTFFLTEKDGIRAGAPKEQGEGGTRGQEGVQKAAGRDVGSTPPPKCELTHLKKHAGERWQVRTSGGGTLDETVRN